jgi:hypothetical protein
MSRFQAAGRVRSQKVWACFVRDCEFAVPAREYTGQACPDHPAAKVRKVRRETVVRPGVVDWPAVQARLREQGILLVGGGADEAPEVYKAPAGRPRRARELDPREAHAAAARGGDGGP